MVATLVAFYADRRHEVRPVRSGYRITLTFNLMLTDAAPTPDAGPVEQAARTLSEHFASRATTRYASRDLGEPARLVFLLDHEYSEAGLRAGRFKGADSERVTALRAAAELAGCETVFALAEIKETWDAIPAGESWGYGSYDAPGTATTPTRSPREADPRHPHPAVVVGRLPEAA